MTATLVDSNVLLDLLTNDPLWKPWSSAAVRQARDRSRLVINPIIYAEIFVRITTIEEVENALPTVFEREPLPYEAAFLAGKCFATYRRRGGAKNAPLPDFFIGAHALAAGYRLLTRDAARYRTYFPTVPLTTPQ